MRTVHWFGALVVAFVAAAQVSASPTASYPYGIASFVESPTQPVIYGAVPSINSVVVINANTLAVTNTIPIGSNPTGLTISPDGSTLYVANSGSSFIARLNTSTLQTLTPLVSPGGSPQKLQFGNGNRLYILGGGGIHEIDATTGASAGPDLGAPEGSYPLITSGGNILISSDHNWLYYGNDGLSPSNAYRFNVSTDNPQYAWAITGGGGNGDCIVLNHAGNMFAYSSVGDDGGTPLRDPSTLLAYGSIMTRGNALAFSADDRTLYTAISFTYSVQQWNVNTFLQSGPNISTAGQPGLLFTDDSGLHLFVGEGSGTEVFTVGVPEPATLGLGSIGLLLLSVRRRKHG